MRRFLTEANSGDVADRSRTHVAGAVYYHRASGERVMKYTIVTLLLMTSVTTAAVAQDGSGQGPPHSPIPTIIVMPQPVSVPTTASPTRPLSKLQLKSELASMTK